MAHSDYHQLFLHLDDLLASNSQWWQIGSFQRRDFPWRETQLELVDRLLSLDEVELLALEVCPQHLARWLGPWIGEAENLLQLSQLPRLPQRTLDIPSRLEVGIKGRKWMQISNFAASIPAPCGTALEWCSGKGHLGRVLAVVDGSQVTSIEWQESLCDAGRQQAQSFQASQRFVQVDARSQAAVAEIGQHSCVLALHACGSLHMDLIRHWPASQSRSLMVAPCCYHLIAGDHYLPLSLQAQAAQVRLSKRCLNLPMQDSRDRM